MQAHCKGIEKNREQKDEIMSWIITEDYVSAQNRNSSFQKSIAIAIRTNIGNQDQAWRQILRMSFISELILMDKWSSALLSAFQNLASGQDCLKS